MEILQNRQCYDDVIGVAQNAMGNTIVSKT